MTNKFLESLEVAEITGGKNKNYFTNCDNICDDFCNDCASDTAMELKPYRETEKNYQK